MNNSFSIWFKLIPEGWKFFGAIVGFGTIIWITAIAVDHWKDKGVNQDNVIEYLKQADLNRKKQDKIKDSIDLVKWSVLYKRLDFISDSISLSLTKQQILTNAVGTLGSKVATTVPALFKLMGGLEFKIIEEIPTKSVWPEVKTRIIKIDTTLKK